MKTLMLYILIPFINAGIQKSYAESPLMIHEFPSGCTVITISKGERVYFAGNDDYINPDSYYWVEPGDSSKYGVIWIGPPDNPQQGINEKGLGYDANGLPRVGVNPHRERIPVPGGYHHYCMQIMHECSTVKEVISWIKSHQRYPYMHDQLHFADATGDAVIISAGKNGEMVFTGKEPGDGFLVSTNFNVADPSNGYDFPCWRFNKAREMLGQLITRQVLPEVRDVTKVMDAVHVESGSGWTIETMVADLVNRVVYIYYFYQYDRPVVLNVMEELSDPRKPGPLSELFPEEVRKEAVSRYHKAMGTIIINKVVGTIWPVMVLGCLILLLLFPGKDKKGFGFWIPAVVLLGPVAVILRILVTKKQKSASWHDALIETLGTVMPLVLAYTLALVFLVLKMLSGNLNEMVQAIMMLGLPLTMVILFHSLFPGSVSRMNYGRLLVRGLPKVLVTTFLGLGGMISVAMPLVNKSLAMPLLVPLSPFAVFTWWTIVVLGGLAGGFFIFLFEMWAVKRGYRAWAVIAGSSEEMLIPSLRKLWWWIPLSIGILFAGLTAGVMLAK